MASFARMQSRLLSAGALDAGVLAVSIVAVGAAVPWRDLLFAYAVGTAAASAGVVRGGLGVVEGALALTLMGAGVRHPVALAAVLIYRFISFWMVISVGWLIYFFGPRTGHRGTSKAAAPRIPALSGPLEDVDLRVPVLAGFQPGDEKRARPEREAAPGRAGSCAVSAISKGRPSTLQNALLEPGWGVNRGSQEGQRVGHGHQVVQMGLAGDASIQMPEQRRFSWPAKPEGQRRKRSSAPLVGDRCGFSISNHHPGNTPAGYGYVSGPEVRLRIKRKWRSRQESRQE